MLRVRTALRELCLLGAFVFALVLVAYPLLVGVGSIGWGFLGEWFV
ncbi:MAG: hypothetical protein JWN86_518, partial [Planctomycetota bacterium]|nr:hypothetical protein [Planctomycetota bacterium]